MKQISFFLILICCAFQLKAQIIINPKGTRITIDSSKWKLAGNNIFFKNTGNVGIGINNPSAQLHTTSTVRFQGLGSNVIDTKILTADVAGNITTRLLSSLPTNADSTTSNNGLTLTGKNIQLGGNLIQPTTISINEKLLTLATGGAAFNITGLTAGAVTDSILTVNTTTGRISRINISALNKIDSTTSDNGLTLTGKKVQLGGNLIQATTIANNANPLTIATGGAAFNITGLTAGATTDSILTINTTTGKINRINISALNKIDSTTSDNGLTLTGKKVQLGGNLTQATTISSNANPLTIATGGAALNITGLTAGAATDSILSVNTTTGKISRINLPSSVNKIDSTTANNGLTLTGKNVQLGGNLTQATTITNNANPLTIATGGAALNITNLPSGDITDSLVVQTGATGQLKKMNVSEFQIKMVELLDLAGTQVLQPTFTNINFNTTAFADPGFIIAAAGITIVNAGVYRLTYRVTANVNTNINAGGEYRLVYAGNQPVPGSLGYTVHYNGNTSHGTVTVVLTGQVPANTTVALQGRRYTTTGNIVLTANGSSILLEKIR